MSQVEAETLRAEAGRILLRWKVMVCYSKMSVKEYDMRRQALLELFRACGLPEPQTTGWVNLRRKLQERDPDIKFPDEIKPRLYRGQY